MNHLYSLVGLTAVVCLMSGCTNNPISTNNGDNSPTTVTAEATGALAFQSIDETQTADNLLATTNPAPANLFDQSAVPSLAVNTSSVLAKKQAGVVGFNIDTINGNLRITSVTPGLLATRYDTIEVRMDAAITDLIDGNESVITLHGATVNIGGTIEYYAACDLDGDGIINGTTGTQRASLTLRTVYTKDLPGFRSGQTTIVTFDADAGTDNNFDTDADNRMHGASWVKLDGADTVAYAFYTDADGDGIITETGKGTVDVRYYESDNPLKPLVAYSKAAIRLERDANGNDRTAQFSAEEKLITGRLNRVWVVDSTGDSTISVGETAIVHFATNSPAVADSEITAQAVFTINPGSDLGNVTDNQCKAIYLAKSYRFGDIDSLEFSCTFDPAVPHGQKPTDGNFSMKVLYRNGQTATLEGTFGAGIIEATFTGPQGDTKDVVLHN